LIGLAALLRIAAASVFVLSAFWKLSHISSFARAFEGFAPARLQRSGRQAVLPVAALELALAAMLLAGLALSQLRFAGPLSSLAVVGVFSILVARASRADECGCWSMPFVDDNRRARQLVLARNAVLLLMLALASALPAGVTVVTAAAVPAGMVLGLLTVELPQIVGVATFRGLRTVDG
jgi:hypothetical protein